MPPAPPFPRLTETDADALARVALANVGTPWPFHLVHFARDAAELQPPAQLHPVFHGSYDWHSCVHMHWTLVRLRTRVTPAVRAPLERHLDARLRAEPVAGELAYCAARPSFERPYGWGWVLKLQAELIAAAATDPAVAPWRDALAPLAALFAARLIDFLPRAQWPVRAGTHGNSAFALLLALDYAAATQHRALHQAIVQAAHRWYGRDARYPAQYEPGGDDFLAPGLVEAVLMQRVVDDCDYADWWQQFAPPPAALGHWLQPVAVTDPRDAKLVHLHGVNLVRAWCWRRLWPALPTDLHAPVRAAIDAHLQASRGAATEGDYVGTHWLASFVVLALQ